MTTPTHYEILSLPPSLYSPNNYEQTQTSAPIPIQTLKTAYRRALLQNHPDKNGKVKGKGKYTIDQIAQAFEVLADREKRRVYDAELKLQLHQNGLNGVRGSGEGGFKTGVETVDLDDLEYEEGKGEWYRGCRCGQDQGFEVKEEDLEEAEGEGEVVVGCKGCSLWLRVLFGVVDVDSEEDGVRDIDGERRGLGDEG
jgi:diphthamide biosynthesis protein 4